MELDKKLTLDKTTIEAMNLTAEFGDEDLTKIANRIYDGFERDRDSRSVWFNRMEAAMDLAMQIVDEKSFPWPGASNVAFPLVTIATLQFHSRAYPQIIQGTDVVRCRIAGEEATPEDTLRADRISRHMSYQVLEEDAAWEPQHDRLLINLPVVGCAFKKTYYNGAHNVSELVQARDFVINYWAKSVETARRKTHIIPLYRNDIYERCASGLFRDVRKEAWFLAHANPMPKEGKQDERAGLAPPPSGDPDAPFICLEQHCWLDLDGDGYEEPYIATVEQASRCLLRLVSRVDRLEDVVRDQRGTVANISATEYFTKYSFIPSPDGGIYDLGFGVLLGPLNESVSTMINQLIDAGTMATTGGGFLGKGAKIRGGDYEFKPLEWKRVDSTGDDLRKNIVPLQVREPSAVLFQLLSLLIEFTNRVSGATEMLSGENPGQNTKVGTTEAMVEQGLKIYGAIFKRVWRGMKEEFKKLYVLNAIHMPVRKALGKGLVALREDYLGDPNHIVPAADPNIVSDSARIRQALAIAERSQLVAGYDPAAVELNLLRAFRIDSPKQFYVGVDPNAKPPVDAKVQVEMIRDAREKLRMQSEQQMFALELMEQHELNKAEIMKLQAAATELLAQAEGAAVNQQLNAINTMVGAMKARNDVLHDKARVLLESSQGDNGDQSGRIRHLVGKPGDQGGQKRLGSGRPGGQESMGGGPVPS
jgi:chaperonin GroES